MMLSTTVCLEPGVSNLGAAQNFCFALLRGRRLGGEVCGNYYFQV